MTDAVPKHKASGLVSNIYHLFIILSPRRRAQLGGLFVLQVFTALSEIVSLSTVVPFLGALTDINNFMDKPLVSWISTQTGISTGEHMAIFLAAVFVGAIVMANILRFITLYVQMHLAACIGTDIGARLFETMLSKPYTYYVQHNSSEMIGGLTNDLRALLGILSAALSFVMYSLIVIAITVSLLIYNPYLSLIMAFVVVGTYGSVTMLVKARLYANSLIISNKYHAYMQTLQEGFGGIRYVSLYRLQKSFIDRYRDSDFPFRKASADNSVLAQAPRYFVESLGIMAICGLAILLILQTRDTATVISSLGFIALAAIRIMPAIQLVYNAIAAILGVRTSLDRMIGIIKDPDTISPRRPSTKPLCFSHAIEFDKVWFDYAQEHEKPLEKWIIRDLSLSIRPRQIVAFVGHTGSGKSTVMDLTLGLLSPRCGEIRVDGIPLSPDNIDGWQSTVAHVPQHIFLMDSSIAENIAFGLKPKDIDMGRVQHSAALAKIDRFIESLPNGYNQTVGERGVRLSGGQIQRIGIARALYHQPAILIFDEATSALDSMTEAEVMAAIEGLGKEMTVILIAHRLSTVKNADNIFVLEKGRLVDQGRYHDLSEKSSAFQSLTRGQS